MLGRLRYGLHAVGGLADHGDAVGGIEYHAEAGPDQFLVVGDHDPDGRIHRTGRRAVRAKPAAELGPTVRLPPHDATRSAMPARPKPVPD